MSALTRRLFTLVELLIVIGVIAILTSILLPALNKAKETAKEITCTGNLKQIGTGTGMYLDDNNEYYPTMHPSYWSGFHQKLLSYCNYKVFYCPSTAEGDGYIYLDSFISYAAMGMDVSLRWGYWSDSTNHPLEPDRTRRICEIKRSPSETAYMIDCKSSFFGLYWSNDSIRKRHKNRCNVLYVDGHIAPWQGYTGTALSNDPTSIRAYFKAESW